jgi:hypothetical protein
MTDNFAPTNAQLSTNQKLGILPIRGEKRLIPINSGLQGNLESLTSRKSPLTEYITVRIKQPNNQVFTYRFLIDPKTISVAHQTLDSHAMTRAGWQFGVWGEDTIDLHISGSTAGQYLSQGLTDAMEEWSLSYRNVVELMNVFENNGYSFEGSDLTSGDPRAADFSRKKIKWQQDVEIRVGNFIWNGMFTTMTLSQTADTPYYNKFTLGFLAWKERYTNSSPWRSPLPNGVYRGHAAELLPGIEAINTYAKSITPITSPERLFPLVPINPNPSFNAVTGMVPFV